MSSPIKIVLLEASGIIAEQIVRTRLLRQRFRAGVIIEVDKLISMINAFGERLITAESISPLIVGSINAFVEMGYSPVIAIGQMSMHVNQKCIDQYGQCNVLAGTVTLDASYERQLALDLRKRTVYQQKQETDLLNRLRIRRRLMMISHSEGDAMILRSMSSVGKKDLRLHSEDGDIHCLSTNLAEKIDLFVRQT